MKPSIKVRVSHVNGVKEPVVVVSNNTLLFHKHDNAATLIENIRNVFDLEDSARLVLYYVQDKDDPADPNTYA
jgi:hypothetical protein